MKLKQTLLCAFASICLAQPVAAIPAYPYPMKVRQADGSVLTIQLRGDEWGHLAMTSDGLPLYFNSATGNYEYARLAKGDLAGSGIVAAEPSARSAAARAYIESMDATAIKTAMEAKREAVVMANIKARQASMAKANGPQRVRINSSFPVTGEPHGLVLLVNFSDTKFSSMTDPKQFYTDMLNKEGFTYTNGADGSVRDFYVANSNGLFKPTWDVVGPLTAAKAASYYGAGGGTSTTLMIELLRDIMKKADDAGVDFSQYDHDGDGYVDNVYLYYAGYGAADTGGNYIWPHALNLKGTYYNISYDGVRIGSYTCSNELRGRIQAKIPTGIGTFVHEFGHVLGLADHYTTGYNDQAFTPGDWDTMDNGSYNNNMNTPPFFSAFERAELGWLDYTDIDYQSGDVALTVPELSSSNKAYRVNVPNKKNEYFVIENRQQQGWDKYIPGHGVLVWHVDMNEQIWLSNNVNNNANHQYLDIVEADGTRTDNSRSADCFPGTADVRNFDFDAWTTKNLFSFYGIDEQDDAVSLHLVGRGYEMPAVKGLTVSDVKDDNAEVRWNSLPAASHYIASVYKVNNDTDSIVVSGYNNFNVSDTTMTLYNLEPQTKYSVVVRATIGAHTSPVAYAPFTTAELSFAKRKVEGLKQVASEGKNISVAWNAVTGADAYLVTLSREGVSDDKDELHYDFTEGLAELPEGWKVSAGVTTERRTGYNYAGASLKMPEGEHTLTAAKTGSKVRSVVFWYRARTDVGTITVERYADGKWTTVDSFEAGIKGNIKNGYIYNSGYAEEFDPSDSVRISCKAGEDGVYIDDVSLRYSPLVDVPVEGFDKVNVGSALTYTFSNLEADTDYKVVVLAVKDGEQSAPSAGLAVRVGGATGIDGVQSETGAARVEVFDLSGRRISDENLRPGVYVFREGRKTYKRVVR